MTEPKTVTCGQCGSLWPSYWAELPDEERLRFQRAFPFELNPLDAGRCPNCGAVLKAETEAPKAAGPAPARSRALILVEVDEDSGSATISGAADGEPHAALGVRPQPGAVKLTAGAVLGAVEYELRRRGFALEPLTEERTG